MQDRLALLPPGGNAPKWSLACLPEEVRSKVHQKLEGGELVALRVPMTTRPKGQQPQPCHFDLFLQRDASVGDAQIIFIREGIIISDVRPRRTSGLRGLVIVDEGPLATFLGDAENPSHTQWQRELVKDKYTYHAATIDYVVQSVWEIQRLLSEDQKKPDSSLLIDLFSIPSDDGMKIKEKRKKKQDGTETEVPEIELPVKPKPFVIQQLPDGFQIRPGDGGAERPAALAIKVAYGVRRGSPFSRYHPADFKLGKNGVETAVAGGNIAEREDNYLLVELTDDDFEIDITGFDTNRDLHIDVRATEKEVADAATT
jgi:hypothetical protein